MYRSSHVTVPQTGSLFATVFYTQISLRRACLLGNSVPSPLISLHRKVSVSACVRADKQEQFLAAVVGG